MLKFRFLISMSLVVVAMVGAFAFTTPQPEATTLLFYNGNSFNSGQVTDEGRWAENNSNGPCTGADEACALIVDVNDVIPGVVGTRKLDPAKIQLGFSGSMSVGYAPTKDPSSSSPNPITPVNKN